MMISLFASAVLVTLPPNGHDIPYRLTDTKHVLVRVKLNGKGPFNFILDTGAPAVFVPKAVAEAAGLKLGKDGWGEFDAFEVEGGLTVPAAKARVEDLFQLEGMNGLGLAGVELHGVIGYNVLARYRVTYDFTKDRLRWVPLAGFDPPPVNARAGKGGQGGLEAIGPLMKVLAAFIGVKPNFTARPRGRLGVEYDERKDGVVVTAVLPDGPAAKAGFKPGDLITAANGRDVDAVGDLLKALAKSAAGDVVKFELTRDGKPVSVTATLAEGL